MRTIKDYNRYGNELERLLLLRTSPLAIKLLEKEEEIPEGAFRPHRDRSFHLSQCQALAMSRRQRISVAMLKEDQWCWAPLIGFGLVDYRAAENFDATKNQVKVLPRLEYGKYLGIISAPLRAANFTPDLVLDLYQRRSIEEHAADYKVQKWRLGELSTRPDKLMCLRRGGYDVKKPVSGRFALRRRALSGHAGRRRAYFLRASR